MASQFDDHGTVVALEFFVQRLIRKQCETAPDPKAAWNEWISAVADHKEQLQRLAFSKGMPPQHTLNALGILAEFDRIMKEVADV